MVGCETALYLAHQGKKITIVEALASDLEFVQFRPTGFIGRDGVKLVSEAVKGAGTKLVNEDGKRFVKDA